MASWLDTLGKPTYTTTTTRPTFTPVTTTPTYKPVVTTPVVTSPPKSSSVGTPGLSSSAGTPGLSSSAGTPSLPSAGTPKLPDVTPKLPDVTPKLPDAGTPTFTPTPAPAPKEKPKANLGATAVELSSLSLGASTFQGGAGNVPFNVRMVLEPSNIKQTGNAPITDYGVFDVKIDYVLRSDVDTLRRYGFQVPSSGTEIGYDEVEVKLTPEQATNLGLTTSTEITFPNLGNQSGDDLNRAILYQASQELGVPSSLNASSLYTNQEVNTATNAVNIQNQLKEQYDFVVQNYPEAAYGGRSRDLDDVFASQAFDLATNGITSIYDIEQKVEGNKTFIVDKNTGKKLFQVRVDPDTKVSKWGENLKVEGGANYGIQFNEEGVPIFFPSYEKSDSGTLGQVFGFVLPILGAYIAGPIGAGVGSTLGQIGQTGEVDFKRVLQTAIAAVGTTEYATSVGNAVGVTGTAAPIVGNSILNAGLSGLEAYATGANIEKSMVAGAVKGAAMVSTKDIANAILGEKNVAEIAKITGLKTGQVENIFTTSVANGLTAEIRGDGEFLDVARNSLISQGIGAKAADLMDRALADVLNKSPEIKSGIIQATQSIAAIASNAALERKDVGQALENNAAGIILVTFEGIREEEKRQEVQRKIQTVQTEIDDATQMALDIASGKVQVAGLPFVAYGLSIGAHAALAYLVSQYETLFPDDVDLQEQALKSNPIYIQIEQVAPSLVKKEVNKTTNKPELKVTPKEDIPLDVVNDLENVVIKIKSDPTLKDSQRISDEVFELLKQFFEEQKPLTPLEEVPPPPPVELKPGPAAEREEGVSGEQGAIGERGGLTGPTLPAPQRVADLPTREAIFNLILNEELERIEQEMQQAEKTAQQAQSNLSRAQEQQKKFSTPDIIAKTGPDLAETLERELRLTAQSAQEAQAAREAAATEKEQIGALQRGEATFSDQQLLDYLRTGDLSFGGAGGAGTGEPGTRGPGTGSGDREAGPGGLEEGAGPGAGETGTGPGAGEEGLGTGGGGEGGSGSGDLTTRLSPVVIFDRTTGGRTETTPFASRVTGEALASILGEKQPLFGGDEDEQRAVWNRRSLRLLSRALGL